jgi:ABC-type dipeptide/oligopeptide/nickel transport system permease subunit
MTMQLEVQSRSGPAFSDLHLPTGAAWGAMVSDLPISSTTYTFFCPGIAVMLVCSLNMVGDGEILDPRLRVLVQDKSQ